MSCMQCGGDRSSMVRLDQDIRSTSGAGGQLNIGYFGDGKAVTLGGECATNVARREPMSNDVPVLTTDTVPSKMLATYTLAPYGVTQMPDGTLPTGITSAQSP